MTSAHAWAWSLSLDLELFRQAHLDSQLVAEDLREAFVLVVVRVDLALAVATFALLRVGVNLEEELAACDLFSAAEDLELVVPLRVAVHGGPLSVARGALELGLHVDARLAVLALERFELAVHAVVVERDHADALAVAHSLAQVVSDVLHEVLRRVNHFSFTLAGRAITLLIINKYLSPSVRKLIDADAVASTTHAQGRRTNKSEPVEHIFFQS